MLQSLSGLIADTLSVEKPLEGRATISFLLESGLAITAEQVKIILLD